MAPQKDNKGVPFTWLYKWRLDCWAFVRHFAVVYLVLRSDCVIHNYQTEINQSFPPE